MLDPVSINGEEPSLVGQPCEELLASEYWYEGGLVEPANVIYLRFAGAWHRLYFDFGIVFWRPHDRAPEPVPPISDGVAYPLVDLGRQFKIQGVVLNRLKAEPVEGGSEVRLEFDNRVLLVFSCIDDTTTYRAEPATASDWANG